MSRHARPQTMLAVVALALSAAAGPPARAQRATLERITHTQTLDNGMQVIVVENHALPLATAEVVVRGGAITQDSAHQGVPHLFEHMLFKGYRNSRGGPFGQDVAEIHAGYNGTTSDESVTYFLTFPSASVDDAIGILAHLLREPRFENEDLQRERFVVMGEYQRSLSEPQFHLGREVSARLWGPAFPRKNTIGDVTSLFGVTPASLRVIFGRYYVPNNAALVVSGDVAAAAVFAMARHHFGGWQRRPDPFARFPVPPIAPLDSSRAVVVTAGVTTVTVDLEWRGPSIGDDPRGAYAADVLADLVNDDQSAFHAHLVESGAFQEAELGYRTLAHVGPITFHGVTTPAKLTTALTALGAELEYMQDSSYFTPRAIAAATRRRRVATVFGLENSAEVAHAVGDWWAIAGLDQFLGYVDNLGACSRADLRALVGRYITGRPFVIGALVPPDQADTTSVVLGQYLSMVSAR